MSLIPCYTTTTRQSIVEQKAKPNFALILRAVADFSGTVRAVVALFVGNIVGQVMGVYIVVPCCLPVLLPVNASLIYYAAGRAHKMVSVVLVARSCSSTAITATNIVAFCGKRE